MNSRTTKKVPIEDFKKYVEELANSKKIEPQTLLDKLTNCGTPGLSSSTKAAHAGVVDRCVLLENIIVNEIFQCSMEFF
jgi:hypothetical protein